MPYFVLGGMLIEDELFLMSALTNVISDTCDWAIDRIHFLSEDKIDVIKSIEDSHAIHCEFHEWLNPNSEELEIISIPNQNMD